MKKVRSLVNRGRKVSKMATGCKEKLAVLYLVMAFQASYICFCFYNSLAQSSKQTTTSMC